MTDRTNNDLGPLTPHTKPRKGAKAVLAGIVAAAGIAGGTAAFVSGGSMRAQDAPIGGGPPAATIKPQPATQPTTAKVVAREARVGGTPLPTTLRAETQPATQPAKESIKAKEVMIKGGMGMNMSLETDSQD